MNLAKLSIFVTLLSVPTIFMMVTVFIFPLLGLFIGYLSYRKKTSAARLGRADDTSNPAMPMYFSVATMVVEIFFINLTYRP